jgi:hypothetical protein
MVTDSPVHVVMAIERTATTVSGQILVGRGPAVEFYGWLELIDQLESALGEPKCPRPSDISAVPAAGPQERSGGTTMAVDVGLPEATGS